MHNRDSEALVDLHCAADASSRNSIAALALNVAAAVGGEPVGYVGRFNCQIALLLTVGLGAVSLRSLRTLPSNAGAALSGHGATN